MTHFVLPGSRLLLVVFVLVFEAANGLAMEALFCIFGKHGSSFVILYFVLASGILFSLLNIWVYYKLYPQTRALENTLPAAYYRESIIVNFIHLSYVCHLQNILPSLIRFTGAHVSNEDENCSCFDLHSSGQTSAHGN